MQTQKNLYSYQLLRWKMELKYGKQSSQFLPKKAKPLSKGNANTIKFLSLSSGKMEIGIKIRKTIEPVFTFHIIHWYYRMDLYYPLVYRERTM